MKETTEGYRNYTLTIEDPSPGNGFLVSIGLPGRPGLWSVRAPGRDAAISKAKAWINEHIALGQPGV
jgi:hypothetical protein